MAQTVGGRRLRLGLVGTGAVMGQHLRGLRAVDRADVVGVVGARAERTAAAANEWGGAPFSTLEAMLDEVRPDAVIVGVPPHLIPAACRLLVERRMPFLAEKPLAANDDAAPGATSVTATSRARGRVAIAAACRAAITPVPTIPKPRLSGPEVSDASELIGQTLATG